MCVFFYPLQHIISLTTLLFSSNLFKKWLYYMFLYRTSTNPAIYSKRGIVNSFTCTSLLIYQDSYLKNKQVKVNSKRYDLRWYFVIVYIPYTSKYFIVFKASTLGNLNQTSNVLSPLSARHFFRTQWSSQSCISFRLTWLTKGAWYWSFTFIV